MKNSVAAILLLLGFLVGCTTVSERPAAPPLTVESLIGMWEGSPLRGDEYFRLDINREHPSYAYEVDRGDVLLYAIDWGPNDSTEWKRDSVVLFDLIPVGKRTPVALCSLSGYSTNRVWITFATRESTIREFELRRVSEQHLARRAHGEDQLNRLKTNPQEPQPEN